MLRNVASGLGLLLIILLTGESRATDFVAKPKRLFGLGDVRLIAVSGDLEYLATAGQGGAFVWDLPGTNLLHRLPGDWSVTALSFSPRSNLLLTATSSTITAWNAEDGRQLQEYTGHVGAISRIRFAPDGKTFVSTGDHTARIWSVETGAELHTFPIPGSPLLDAAISPDGRKLVTIDTFLTNCVKVWEIASKTQIAALLRTNWNVQHCLFTPTGQLLTASSDRNVTLWNIETAEPLRTFSGITGIAIIHDLWMPNDSTVAAACNDGSVFLWNLHSGELLREVPGEPAIAAIGVPNDHITIVAHLDYNVRVRQLPGGDTLRTFVGHTTSTHRSVAFSPDGRFVLSGGTEAAARLWDRETGTPVRTFVGSPAGTMAAAFSADGSRIITTIGLPNPGVRLWRTDTGELEREFLWSASWPMAAALSKDGTRIAGAAQDGRVRIFDVASAQLLRSLTASGFINALDFAPNAPLIATGSSDSNARIFNHETGELIETVAANGGAVLTVAFSPDGGTLLVGWADGIIHLYDAPAFELRREFFAPAAFLEAAVFSPDGQYILTGEGWPFFTATIWDAQSAEALRSFQGHKWSVGGVGFSSDGASILTGAESVREWPIADLAARIKVEKISGQLRLTWSYGQLEHSPDLGGPWETLTNAVSPFHVPAEIKSRFFRARTE